jgi:glutathione S-transferase
MLTLYDYLLSVFPARFPNGRIPAVEWDDGRLLFESGAILWLIVSSEFPGLEGYAGSADAAMRWQTPGEHR